MPGYEAPPGYAERVRASFARQRAMGLLGARLAKVEPGLVEVELPFRDDLTQQHGYLHAGVVSAIADSAGGYAAYTLMPPDHSVLAVEYKMNFLAPARGQRFLARGRVLRPGRTLTVCELQVAAFEGAASTVIAHGTQTCISLAPRPGAPQG
jgi:uncharacterized protein (TIGR00369 family)